MTVAVIFLAVDAVWLSLTGDALYRHRLGAILLDHFRPVPALLFYPLYVAGIVVFAVTPADLSRRHSTAAARGAFLGLVAYGTYDLTNQATLKDWSAVITAADLAWGMAATALAAGLGFALTRSTTAGAGESQANEKHQLGGG
jgi:uncharacterized membrane protein